MIWHLYFQVLHVERDIKKAKEGEGGDLVYRTLMGLTNDLATAEKPEILNKESGEDESETESDSSESEDNAEVTGESKQKTSCARPRDESPNSRRVSYR